MIERGGIGNMRKIRKWAKAISRDRQEAIVRHNKELFQGKEWILDVRTKIMKVLLERKNRQELFGKYRHGGLKLIF